jgi:hypothetical protein
VAITIRKVGQLYEAEVTPLDSDAAWSSPRALNRDELIAELRRIGCHTTDIGDAFYAADAGWLDPN